MILPKVEEKTLEKSKTLLNKHTKKKKKSGTEKNSNSLIITIYNNRLTNKIIHS